MSELEKKADPQAVRYLPSLELAFLGDAVLELDVRFRALQSSHGNIDQLHRLTVRHVQATAQAIAARALLPLLDETETDVFRRAKNTKPLRVPKSATLADYRFSTGIEAVIGFLYLVGRSERLQWLLAELWQAGSPESIVVEEE